MKITHRCIDCEREAVKDEEKSNNNWEVFSTTCTYCGGEVKMNFN